MQPLAEAPTQQASISAETPSLYLDTGAAARRLSCKARLLQSLRSTGGGPRWVRIGRQVRYRSDWLDAWAEANSVSSKTEEAARRADTGVRPRATSTLVEA